MPPSAEARIRTSWGPAEEKTGRTAPAFAQVDVEAAGLGQRRRELGERQRAAERDGAAGHPEAEHHERIGNLAGDAGRRAEDAGADRDADDQGDRAPEAERAGQPGWRLVWRPSGPRKPSTAASLSPLDRPAHGCYDRSPWPRANWLKRPDFRPVRARDGTARSTRRSAGWPTGPSTVPTRRICTSRRCAGCRAVAAQYAPFPAALDARLRRRARRPRHPAALHASGRGDRACARRPPRRRHHADGVGQDALLQRAGPPLDAAGSVEPRAVSLSDQGARAGSARRAAGAVRDARRARRASRSASSPTTATRRRTRGGRSARARISC